MRIQPEMTVFQVITTMGEGNPGAITVMCELMKRYSLEGMVCINVLDSQGIYGPNIWVAFKDVCKQDYDVLKSKILDGSILKLLKDSQRADL